NLVERNGRSAKYDHGIYIGGTNHVIRGNVIRNNVAFGIQFYAHSSWDVTGCKAYNNLIYHNGTASTDGVTDGIVFEPNNSGATCDIFGNTIIANNGYAIQGGGVPCTLRLTNNIIISSQSAGVQFSTGTVFGDYNLSGHTLSTSGPHDVVSSG